MDYNYVKVKDFNYRIECNGEEQRKYVLSFSERQHIKVSETAKLIIDNFDGKRTLKEIVERLSGHEIEVSEEDLIRFVDTQLVTNAVLEGMESDTKSHGSSFMWCHLPVVKSDQLAGLFGVLKVMYHKPVAVVVLSLIAFCISFSIYMNFANHNLVLQVDSLMIILLSYLSLLLHEFGHISAAYSAGIKAGNIGVGMYLFSPVFYVDMTNTWRLGNKKRVLVDVGGMYFQLMLTIPITIMGYVSGNPFYYLINLFIVALTLANLMPFIKLDGYWIMCDYLEINNISTNAIQIVVNFMNTGREDGIDGNDKYGSRKKGYILISLIYLVSTATMLFLGIIMAVKAIINFDSVVSQMSRMAGFFAESKLAAGFTQLNRIFIFLLPVLFLFFMISKLLGSVIKGFIKGIMKHNNQIDNEAEI